MGNSRLYYSGIPTFMRAPSALWRTYSRGLWQSWGFLMTMPAGQDPGRDGAPRQFVKALFTSITFLFQSRIKILLIFQRGKSFVSKAIYKSSIWVMSTSFPWTLNVPWKRFLVLFNRSWIRERSPALQATQALQTPYANQNYQSNTQRMVPILSFPIHPQRQ